MFGYSGVFFGRGKHILSSRKVAVSVNTIRNASLKPEISCLSDSSRSSKMIRNLNSTFVWISHLPTCILFFSKMQVV